MSDNEDLLADDLGDHSLADYNLGNDEEDQLLADDYEGGGIPHNVPATVAPYVAVVEPPPPQFPEPEVQYPKQRIQYHLQPDTGESVVPNITVEVPNVPERPSYAPYEPPPYREQAVPPAMSAAPLEPPQTVPGELGEGGRERFSSERPLGAQRMPQHRDIPDTLDKVIVPRGGWNGGRGRTSWRSPHYNPRYQHPYRRNNVYRGNFNQQRPSFPPPQQMRASPPQMRPEMRPNPPQMRPEMPHNLRPEMPPNIRPDLPQNLRPDLSPNSRPDIPQNIRQDLPPNLRPDLPPNLRPDLPNNRPDLSPRGQELPPNVRPELRPDLPQRPDLRPDLPPGHPDLPQPGPPGLGPELPLRQEFRDLPPHIPQDLPPENLNLPPNMPMENYRHMERPPFRFQNQFRDERPFLRPNFDPFYRPFRPFPPMREVSPNMNQIPQVTIRHPLPPNSMGPGHPNSMGPRGPPMGPMRPNMGPGNPGIQQEVRMLPVQLPVPAGALAGKKVLINPHFKGNFQPPVEGLLLPIPAYIPTKIPKSPPASAAHPHTHSPTREHKFGLTHLHPTYTPTRISKSPPLSPTLENKFGPVKDIDDAAERFIAEQRNALARAATRKFPPARRSPQRYIENTTIEIENELARPPQPARSPPPAPKRRNSEDELLRRQEEFINANRAGLRRRMRSPSPPARRSPSPAPRSPAPRSPRRSPERLRMRIDTARTPDEDIEYRRRMREQEALRERVMRAKEARRRRNAAQHHADKGKRDPEPEKEREPIREAPREIPRSPARSPPRQQPRSPPRQPPRSPPRQPLRSPPRQPPRSPPKPEPVKPEPVKPDTTRKSPEKPPERIRERSPIRETPQVNSTCEGLTPPRCASPALTPPLPAPAPADSRRAVDSDDDLDLILEDIDGILSDDDDTGRFKGKSYSKPDPPKPSVDLRSKLPPKTAEKRPPRKPIVFEPKEEKTRKSPPRRSEPTRKAAASSSTKEDNKKDKSKEKAESKSSIRQRITFDKKETEKETTPPKEKEKEKESQKTQFSNRRVILQRKPEKSVFTRIEVKSDPTKPNPGIFSRAVRTAIGNEKNRIVINKKSEEPQVEYESESDDDEKVLNEIIGSMAMVTNLPHGMTDTRLKTLAGNDVQTLTLDKEERSAKITFKTTVAAEHFKKKFNNKMVAASRLTVILR